MVLLIHAIALLSFSAFFAAYLLVAYTPSFQIATFAKSFSMLLFFAGIIMGYLSIYCLWLHMQLHYCIFLLLAALLPYLARS